MGYVHDTAVCQHIPLNTIKATVGTWTLAGAANVWSLNRTAADNTSVLHIPLSVLQNAAAQKGSLLKSIDIYYTVSTADSDAISAVLQKATLPAHGGAVPAVAPITTYYDANHDTAPKRVTNGATMHKMTLTLGASAAAQAPVWMDDDEEYYIELTVDGAATSVEKIYAVRANLTVRL